METSSAQTYGWEVEVWRTFDAGVEEVWDLLVSDQGLSIWLGDDAVLDLRDERWSSRDADGVVERFAPGTELRLRLPTEDRSHHTDAHLAVVPTDGGTRLELRECDLRDPGERTRRRHHWRGIADRLQAALDER